MMLTGARGPISPCRFPFPRSKNPEGLINPKVASKLQTERILRSWFIHWQPHIHLPSSPRLQRGVVESRFSTVGVSAYCCDDVYMVQSLYGTQGCSSTLQLPGSSSLDVYANTQIFQQMCSSVAVRVLTCRPKLEPSQSSLRLVLSWVNTGTAPLLWDNFTSRILFSFLAIRH